jgi:DNA repair protein RadC
MPVRMIDVPAHERPRERLLRRGVEALTERELLALVLRNGAPGENAIDVASALLAEFGSLAAIARARPEELARRRGVGTAKAAALVAAFQLGRRAASDPETAPVLRSATAVAAVARPELDGLRRERVLVLVCDGANRLRKVVTVSEGATDRALISTREVLQAVLRHDGRAFALAHNHPAGDPEPSEADRDATVAVAAAARSVEVRFLGHIIVGGNQWGEVPLRPS